MTDAPAIHIIVTDDDGNETTETIEVVTVNTPEELEAYFASLAS